MTTTPSTRSHEDALRQYLGFRNRYDFFLWALFGGILAIFCLIRIPHLHPPTFARGIATSGEWYWLRQQPFGIFLHLGTILPAGLLCITQFIPRIRSISISTHRRIGYIVIGLVSVSTIGCLLISRHTFGGDIATQAGIFTLVFMTDGAMLLAWWNITKLQIDEHRKWMIRAIVWMSQIITLRIVLYAGVFIISSIGGYSSVWTCDEAIFISGNATTVYAEFPQCRILGPETAIVVPMNIDSALHLGSGFRGMFATALWVATALHVFAVEVYLALTSEESERLRIVSYYKQRAAGLKHSGSAGITNDRWGDAKPWRLPIKAAE